MPKSLLLIMFSMWSAGAAAQSTLTDAEQRWLKAGTPVIAYAKQLALPIDIIVQPQAGPNDVPLAMGFDAGRCKLVLSLRGNPKAENILTPLPPEQRALMIEVMMAHEIGHCWRYARNDWHVLPAGFVEAGRGEHVGDDPALLRLEQLRSELRATRREEGFADLVALAWTQLRHPAAYRDVYGWMAQLRRDQPHASGSHSTANWLKLAADPAVFAAAATPFEQGQQVWRLALAADE